MANSNEPKIIIIKKKKKGGHDGHHGGAWKVAYADFVTAMMAFFLLLWLLNVTTDDQKAGIADYFDPSNIARATSGAGGVLGGRSVNSPGQQSSPSSRFSLQQSLPGHEHPSEDTEYLDDGSQDTPSQAEEDHGPQPDDASQSAMTETIDEIPDEELERLADAGPTEALLEAAAEAGMAEEALEEMLEEALAEREQELFEAAEEALRQAIQSVTELQALEDNLLIDQTPEGLRIQIVDQEGLSMFPIGSADMHDRTHQLLALIAEVVGQLPKDISITGHTDSTPYTANARYGNWELSTDRANASRRALVESGLPRERISYVVGKSDTDHLFPDHPYDPRNRRISIVLLREAPLASG